VRSSGIRWSRCIRSSAKRSSSENWVPTRWQPPGQESEEFGILDLAAEGQADLVCISVEEVGRGLPSLIDSSNISIRPLAGSFYPNNASAGIGQPSVPRELPSIKILCCDGVREIGLSPKAIDYRLAERVGFEPTLEFPLNTLSKRAPSTTRPPLLFVLRLAKTNPSRTSRDAAPRRRSRGPAGPEFLPTPQDTYCCWLSRPWQRPDVLAA
jgi:hypothetical protein